MTSEERAAVHKMAGAFGKLAIAAELVSAAPPEGYQIELEQALEAQSARAGAIERLERMRKQAIAEFSAALDELSRRPA